MLKVFSRPELSWIYEDEFELVYPLLKECRRDDLFTLMFRTDRIVSKKVTHGKVLLGLAVSKFSQKKINLLYLRGGESAWKIILKDLKAKLSEERTILRAIINEENLDQLYFLQREGFLSNGVKHDQFKGRDGIVMEYRYELE